MLIVATGSLFIPYYYSASPTTCAATIIVAAATSAPKRLARHAGPLTESDRAAPPRAWLIFAATTMCQPENSQV